MPYHRKPLAPSEECGGDQWRVVEVNELETLSAKRAPELAHVTRQPHELPAEEKPAAAPVRRCPNVGEPGDRPGVDDGAGLPKQVSRRPWRTVDVGLEEFAIEFADQIRERFGRTAELGAMVDEEDRERTPAGHASNASPGEAGPYDLRTWLGSASTD